MSFLDQAHEQLNDFWHEHDHAQQEQHRLDQEQAQVQVIPCATATATTRTTSVRASPKTLELKPPQPAAATKEWLIQSIPRPLLLKKKTLGNPDEIVQLGFGGCGGMYNYFLGVAAILQEQYDLSNVYFSGASAGTFPATVLSLGLDIEEFFFKGNLPLIEEAAQVSYSGFFKWNAMTREHMLRALEPDAYKRVNDRLYLSLTKIPSWRNEMVGCWTSNEDLIDCMLTSAFLPIYNTSMFATYRGKKYIDGSFSNHNPVGFPYLKYKVLQIGDWRWVAPHWFLITTNADWATQLYQWGRQDALANIDEVERFFAVEDTEE